MINRKTAAIIGAYTGVVFGGFGEIRDYIETLMDKDPNVNPFANDGSVRAASKEDFIAIKVDNDDPEAMTEREAAIITAFTGFALGNFGEAQLYIEEILDRPVWTHQLGERKIWEEIKEKSRPDFLALGESIVD